MEELLNFDISENTLKSMLELNPQLIEISNEEVIDKINILSSIGCTEKQIINIISSNSIFLTRTCSEINELIKYLVSKGFSCLNILFDSNPYILNMDSFEIDNYINDKLTNGMDLEDIVDELDSNPYLFNEM